MNPIFHYLHQTPDPPPPTPIPTPSFWDTNSNTIVVAVVTAILVLILIKLLKALLKRLGCWLKRGWQAIRCYGFTYRV